MRCKRAACGSHCSFVTETDGRFYQNMSIGSTTMFPLPSLLFKTSLTGGCNDDPDLGESPSPSRTNVRVCIYIYTHARTDSYRVRDDNSVMRGVSNLVDLRVERDARVRVVYDRRHTHTRLDATRDLGET